MPSTNTTRTTMTTPALVAKRAKWGAMFDALVATAAPAPAVSEDDLDPATKARIAEERRYADERIARRTLRRPKF